MKTGCTAIHGSAAQGRTYGAGIGEGEVVLEDALFPSGIRITFF